MSAGLRPLYVPSFGPAVIIPEQSGYYQPAERGKSLPTIPAVILGVADRCGELVDIVAWKPAEPARCWSRTGTAAILGEAEIDRAACLGLPLHLFATPHSWLFNHAPGGIWPAACIIDWSADPRLLLQGVEIVCENAFLARRLEQAQRKHERSLRIGIRNGRRTA